MLSFAGLKNFYFKLKNFGQFIDKPHNFTICNTPTLILQELTQLYFFIFCYFRYFFISVFLHHRFRSGPRTDL